MDDMRAHLIWFSIITVPFLGLVITSRPSSASR